MGQLDHGKYDSPITPATSVAGDTEKFSKVPTLKTPQAILPFLDELDADTQQLFFEELCNMFASEGKKSKKLPNDYSPEAPLKERIACVFANLSLMQKSSIGVAMFRAIRGKEDGSAANLVITEIHKALSNTNVSATVHDAQEFSLAKAMEHKNGRKVFQSIKSEVLEMFPDDMSGKSIKSHLSAIIAHAGVADENEIILILEFISHHHPKNADQVVSRFPYLQTIDDNDRKALESIISNIELKERLKHLPQVLHAFINEHMRNFESETLLALLRSILMLLIKPDFKMEINIGYGGTMDSLNARVPAYVIAGTDILEKLLPVIDQLKEKGIVMNLPKLRLLSGYNAGVMVNGFDKEVARKNAENIFRFTTEYVATFHPEIADHIVLDYDTPEFYLSRVMSISLSAIVDGWKSESKVSGRLQSMGQNHGGEDGKENSQMYAAAHVGLFHEIMEADSAEIPDAVLSIGGNPERLFNAIRHRIVEVLRGDNLDDFYMPDTARGISEAGRKPVYYHDEEGDMTFQQALDGKSIDNCSEKVQRDFAVIMADMSNVLFARLIKGLPQEHDAGQKNLVRFIHANMKNASSSDSIRSILSKFFSFAQSVPAIDNLLERFAAVKSMTEKKKSESMLNEIQTTLVSLFQKQFVQFLRDIQTKLS